MSCISHRIHGAGIHTNIGGILMGSMLPYIAAPWIRHGIWILYIKLPDGLIMSRCPDFRCPVDSTTPSDFFRSVVSVRLPRVRGYCRWTGYFGIWYNIYIMGPATLLLKIKKLTMVLYSMLFASYMPTWVFHSYLFFLFFKWLVYSLDGLKPSLRQFEVLHTQIKQ